MPMKIDEQLSYSMEIRILNIAATVIVVEAIATIYQEQHQHRQGKIHQ